MKRLIWMSVLLSLLTGLVWAGENGNEYPNGVEGIKGASAPPPGFYLRNYTFNYVASSLRDAHRRDVPAGFKVGVWAEAPRFLYVTKKRFLGGNYAFDFMIPLIHTGLTVKAAGVEKSTAGVGDIYFSPALLTWHGERYDAVGGISFFAPTGGWSIKDPSKPGKNCWTTMITGGATVYLDKSRKWSASLLNRYEIHSARRSRDLTLGNDFHFEWGVGRSLTKTVEVGVSGYGQFQVTPDQGKAFIGDRSIKDRVLAIGPEIDLAFPNHMLFLSLRYLPEFGARDRSQGQIVVITLTKGF